MKNIVFAAIGQADGLRKVDNQEVLDRLASQGSINLPSSEEASAKLGIDSRLLAESIGSTDLAFLAAEDACRKATNLSPGFDPKDIELIIGGSSTPDAVYPAMACLIQERLGIPSCRSTAFDVSLACTTALTAISIAKAMMLRSKFRYALVVLGETVGSRTEGTDVSQLLWGDGGVAVLLKQIETFKTAPLGVISDRGYSEGSKADWTLSRGIGSDPAHRKGPLIASMEGHGLDIQKYVLGPIKELARQFLDDNGLNTTDYVSFHNGNGRMIEKLTRQLGYRPDQLLTVIKDRGNVSSCSVILNIVEAFNTGQFQSGETILLSAFGGGMGAWNMLYRFPDKNLIWSQ